MEAIGRTANVSLFHVAKGFRFSSFLLFIITACKSIDSRHFYS